MTDTDPSWLWHKHNASWPLAQAAPARRGGSRSGGPRSVRL